MSKGHNDVPTHRMQIGVLRLPAGASVHRIAVSVGTNLSHPEFYVVAAGRLGADSGFVSFHIRLGLGLGSRLSRN